MSSYKALSTWNASNAIQECREACGGLGYSFYSQFQVLKSYQDVHLTWEGDNNVLIQQTGKYLLDHFRKKMKGKEEKNRSCSFITTSPVQGTEFDGQPEDIPEKFLDILRFRTNLLLQNTGMRLANKIQENKKDPIGAWNAS